MECFVILPITYPTPIVVSALRGTGAFGPLCFSMRVATRVYRMAPFVVRAPLATDVAPNILNFGKVKLLRLVGANLAGEMVQFVPLEPHATRAARDQINIGIAEDFGPAEMSHAIRTVRSVHDTHLATDAVREIGIMIGGGWETFVALELNFVAFRPSLFIFSCLHLAFII